MCDTEFYKPLDYDDQLLPDYLERASAAMDEQKLDVYGCLLMTLEDGQFSARKWPHKPLETMFTGNSDDNMLPHSSVLMRASICRAAGNYQERAVGLGADDYNLWYRIHQAGGKFWRDDSRKVVYRIHAKNSLKIRKARYGGASIAGSISPAPTNSATPQIGRRLAGAAAAAAVIAIASSPASAAPNAAPAPPQHRPSMAQPPSDLLTPKGLLDRWVAKVKRTSKFAMGQLNRIPLPDPPAKNSAPNAHAPVDLPPPHS
jgi:hypothetical protein